MNKQNKKDLVPVLRFPEFRGTEDWKVQKLEKIIEEYRETSTKQDEFEVLTSSRAGLVPQRDYYGTTRITERDNIGFNIIPPNHITYRSRSDDRKFFFNENTLGITGIISTYYPVFRLLDSNNKFFVELLSRHHREIGKHSVGTSQTVLSMRELKKIELPIPQEAEQKKIADCLNSIDKLITIQTQKLDTLKIHKKGLLQKLYPTEGETVPRLRFPEFRHQGEWSIKTLGKVAENLDAKRVPITKSDRKKGVIPYYGASGVIDYVESYIFDEELLCISEDGANLVARTSPIAFSISGKTWVNNHAHVLRFKHRFTQTIVENYLNATNLEDFITGMAQPKLNQAKLEIIPIPLPEKDEQIKIADCLNSIDELITNQTQKVDALKTHKSGLTQQLFSAMDEVR